MFIQELKTKHILKLKILCLCLFSTLLSGQLKAQSMMTQEERQFVVKYLQDTKLEFLKATEGLTEA